ncbi:MAG: HK97 family phage prohead protease [Eubacteriales bacterium]|nr:HK97 family phage prohead protease [Eubacteriales bacterium]
MSSSQTTMNKKRNKTLGQRDLYAGNQIRAADEGGGGNRFVLSFSSEEPYERFWGREILSHADGCVDLARLSEIGVVLFNHDRDKVVGKITRAWVENGRGNAEIEFDTDDKSQLIAEKVRSGTLKGVSVGYRVERWEVVESGSKSADGRFDGPCEIATKWMPFEISIVSVPADATVGVGREAEEQEKREEAGASRLAFYESLVTLNQNYGRKS